MKPQDSILVLLHAYYLDDTRVKRHCELLAQSGKKVTVLCLNKGKERSKETVNSVIINRAPIARSKLKSKLFYLIEYFLFFVFCFFKSTKSCFGDKPSLIIVNNMPNALVFTAIVPKIFGIPILLDVHDLMPELVDIIFKKKGSLLKKVLVIEERMSFVFASYLMTVSLPVKKLLEKRSKYDFFIVHNSPYHLPVLNKEVNNDLKVVFHGNIHERYGLQRVLEPLNIVRNTVANVRLDIHGKGPYVDDLTILIKPLDFVHFHGCFSPEDVPAILANASLGIVMNYPNHSNDFALPVKMLEYIANKVPVICPRLPVLLEYFSSESVFYFNDDDDLAEVLLFALSEPKLREKKAASAFEEYQEISWDNEKNRYIEYIDKILK
ncbi:MAG: glycosyltransferase [Colwellia sp.]|nr:glycosyltransferase [Colwellia sp.]